MDNNCCKICSNCASRTKKRDDVLKKELKTRLNRTIGQLNGISKMIDDNRYCGDILMQVSASLNSLRAFANVLLKDHLSTCVSEEIKKGNNAVIDEVMELIRNLK